MQQHISLHKVAYIKNILYLQGRGAIMRGAVLEPAAVHVPRAAADAAGSQPHARALTVPPNGPAPYSCRAT